MLKTTVMATVWFTADLHLGHANIIRYCLRPFLSATEKERALGDPRGRWRPRTTRCEDPSAPTKWFMLARWRCFPKTADLVREPGMARASMI